MNEIDRLKRLTAVKMIIFDVDGVLTDGTIYKGTGDQEFKQFSVLDGLGFFLAQAGGLKIALISGRYSPATEARVKELSFDAVYNGAVNKLKPYEELKKKFGYGDENIAYVGDDLIDIPVMEKVGFPVAVANAQDLAKQAAAYTTRQKGGNGAAREVIDLVLTAQNKYDLAYQRLRKERYE